MDTEIARIVDLLEDMNRTYLKFVLVDPGRVENRANRSVGKSLAVSTVSSFVPV